MLFASLICERRLRAPEGTILGAFIIVVLVVGGVDIETKFDTEMKLGAELWGIKGKEPKINGYLFIW